MSKAIQALLTGMLITFILDFFIFLGIKQNYIDFYEINLYYNILFADHQNIYIFFTGSIISGFIIIYINSKRVSIVVLSVLSILAVSTLITEVGYKVGETLLMTKDVTFKGNRHTYTGDIYYNGREQITFYDNELQKIILLDKKEIQ